MSDWKDFEEGRPGLKLSPLSDGESIDVFIDEEPYLHQETIDQEDGTVEESESLRVPVVPVAVPDGFADMSGEAVSTVDDAGEATEAGEEAPRYHIINSSTAFKRAMRDAFPGEIAAAASVVRITAHQPEGSDVYGRSYTVEEDP